MASTAVPTYLTTLFRSRRKCRKSVAIRSFRLLVFASDGSVESNQRQKHRKQGVDTRIHWSGPDEGWVGGKSAVGPEKQESFGEKFSELLKEATGSYYEFLGVSVQADVEEIKAAYRRLTKEYHPDTTTLPLKAASDKFMRLREAYDVLSDEEKRRFYDWSLAQEAASKQAERMKLRLEDPHEQDATNWESVPDKVDRLGGKNMKLSDQTLTAITIDAAIIFFSICCIIYVIFFKDTN